MDREEIKEEIKARIPLTDYLQKSPKGNYICPYCGSGTGRNRTGAVKIYEETKSFYCHACGKSGDVIDLYQNQNNVDYNTALSLMAEACGVQSERTGGRRSRRKGAGDNLPAGDVKGPLKAAQEATGGTPDYTAYYEECRARLNDPAAVSYLEGRGISLEIAQAHNLGYDPAADPAGAGHPAARIIIPTNKAHYVARAIDPNTAREYQKLNVKGSTPGIFNAEALYTKDTTEIFVVEGIFDALSIMEAGAEAIALNSANNVDKLIKQIEERPTKAILIISLDNDADEKTRAKIEEQKAKLAAGLEKLFTTYSLADINGPYKDANEFLQNDRAAFIETVEAARQDAQPKNEMDVFLAETYTEKYKAIPTGIKALDRLLNGGFIPQTLVLLGGEAGTGKTALATQIFENMAAAGHECIYLNLEMSKQQMLARGLARQVYIKYPNLKLTALNILRGYEQTEPTREKVRAAAAEYQENILNNMHYNPDNVTNELDSILDYIDRKGQIAQAAGQPAPNICVDYLHIMTGKVGEDSGEMLKRAVARLKEYAAKYNAVVLAIIAHKRTANDSQEVSMSAGRDTSALEYSADLQLSLRWKDKKKHDYIELHVTKSRFTQTVMEHGAEFTLRGGQSYFDEVDNWTSAGAMDANNPFAGARL